jgi:hypothetical protein
MNPVSSRGAARSVAIGLNEGLNESLSEARMKVIVLDLRPTHAANSLPKRRLFAPLRRGAVATIQSFLMEDFAP